MKIGIHQETSGSAIGGSEFVVAVLAHFLRQQHEVEIILHRSHVQAHDFADFFQINLDGVKSRHVPQSVNKWIDPLDRWWRLSSDQAQRSARLSESYDLFITVTHSVPPVCRAPHGVLYVLFPFFNRMDNWPWNQTTSNGLRGIANRIRREIYERAWQSRFASYDHHLAISQFAADWTARYWGDSCKVLPPPVACSFADSEKTNQIVVLGRITPGKKQRELVATFRTAYGRFLRGWSMVCLGGLSNGAEEQEYYEETRRSAGTAPVRILPNAPRDVLRTELERSKIFWHGMGLGEDENLDPSRLEHFGIATVEAMAIGCVPVVIGRGGQREIVEDGINGFLCENLEEMVEKTVLLSQDGALCDRMAEAAVCRAREFSVDRFFARFQEITHPLLVSDKVCKA
jgi:glycosyltransferase involved in cell wall biosynthesis